MARTMRKRKQRSRETKRAYINMIKVERKKFNAYKTNEVVTSIVGINNISNTIMDAGVLIYKLATMSNFGKWLSNPVRFFLCTK